MFRIYPFGQIIVIGLKYGDEFGTHHCPVTFQESQNILLVKTRNFSLRSIEQPLISKTIRNQC